MEEIHLLQGGGRRVLGEALIRSAGAAQRKVQSLTVRPSAQGKLWGGGGLQ